MKNQTNIETRSKLWGEYLNLDKQMPKLLKKSEKYGKEAEIARMNSDINSFQESINKMREINTKLIIAQMQLQQSFLNLINLEQYNVNPIFN